MDIPVSVGTAPPSPINAALENALLMSKHLHLEHSPQHRNKHEIGKPKHTYIINLSGKELSHNAQLVLKKG